MPALPGVARVGDKNDIASDRLAPTLLRDTDEMAEYLRAFPRDQYKVYPNVLIGNFYVDDIDDAIKNQLRTGGGWERPIYRLLQANARAGTTAIDAGAHIGTHTVSLARFVGPEGRVYAFEPQKKLYRELVENLKLQGIFNVYPLRFALGDQHSVVEMSPRRATKAERGLSARPAARSWSPARSIAATATRSSYARSTASGSSMSR
jgi:FkbM family methyltransferase